MSADVVDLFAGPGGWDVGAARLGLDVLGIDTSADACSTAAAAGHARQRADVTTLDPTRSRGLIGSPPCQGFSRAGKGRGYADAAQLLARVADIRQPSDVAVTIAGLHADMADDRSVLTLEPLRWAMCTRPTWIACEQVPTVLPIWDACAAVLRRVGYSTATGVLSSEAYGVPQVRRRAVLLARLDDVAELPRPTHSRYHARTPDRLDADVERWLTMSRGLGWGDAVEAYPDPLFERFRDQSGTPFDPLWPTRRPSTVVAGRGLVQNPGTTSNRFNDSTKSRNDGVRVTVREAAMLQTFPDGYPWAGTSSSRYQQIGDAVPPLLAEAILRAVTS